MNENVKKLKSMLLGFIEERNKWAIRELRRHDEKMASANINEAKGLELALEAVGELFGEGAVQKNGQQVIPAGHRGH